MEALKRAHPGQAAGGQGRDRSINQILRLAREADVTVQIVDRVKLEMLARAEGVHAHQGVAAYLSFARAAFVEDMIRSAEEKGEPPFIVVLDGITDPYNVGSILRSAECLGAHGVVIPDGAAPA